MIKFFVYNFYNFKNEVQSEEHIGNEPREFIPKESGVIKWNRGWDTWRPYWVSKAGLPDNSILHQRPRSPVVSRGPRSSSCASARHSQQLDRSSVSRQYEDHIAKGNQERDRAGGERPPDGQSSGSSPRIRQRYWDQRPWRSSLGAAWSTKLHRVNI